MVVVVDVGAARGFQRLSGGRGCRLGWGEEMCMRDRGRRMFCRRSRGLLVCRLSLGVW